MSRLTSEDYELIRTALLNLADHANAMRIKVGATSPAAVEELERVQRHAYRIGAKIGVLKEAAVKEESGPQFKLGRSGP